VRVILFTGKGGVGKTTLAAATAARVAEHGAKTLVISTDTAHSLADAFETTVGGEPHEVAPGLYMGHVDAQRRLHQVWGDLQGYLASALGASGIDRLRAEELTVLPGAEELLALLEVREHALSGRWEAVIVDCAPTGETLRLLALPEALDRYLHRVLPSELKVVRALRPLLGPAMGLPAPKPEVWEAAEQLQIQLAEVQGVLQSPDTSVRLVLTPESVVVAEARRSFTQLALFGYRVDAVIANRVFEADGDDWRRGWAARQDRVLMEAVESFDPLPVQTAGYRQSEPVGAAALASLGRDVYGSSDPLGGSDATEFMRITTILGGYEVMLRLPLVDKSSLELTRVGDELAITVSGRRRLIAMPTALGRCSVQGARMDGDLLRVTFRPDSIESTAFPAHP
jgi:arsenite-transporting ATPase